jgi:hypothetical protein
MVLSMHGLRRICPALIALFAALGVLLVPQVPVTAAPTSHGSSWSSAVVSLPNGAVGYDQVRNQVLVAVAPSSPVLGNHLVEMDPHTGQLGRSVAVGSNPWTMAVSDDASRAYIGLGGAPIVTEVDLATFTVVRSIYLGTGGFLGAFYAEDIDVQPGNPGVIAVSRRNLCCSPRHEGVAIYENGVKRPDETGDHTGANRITWSDDPAVLYGYNNETTGFGFYRLTVDGDGVSIAQSSGGLVAGFGVDIEFGDGLVHATNGQVVNPLTMSLAGSYTTSGKLEVDEAQHKTFTQSGTTLSRHDVTTKLTDWSVTVPNVTVRDLVDAEDVLVAAGGSTIALLGPGVSSSGFVLPDPPESIVQTWAAHSASVAVQQVVSSPDGSHVYGVVRSTASTYPGEVVEVNAESGVVERHLFVGADPHRIAISDDGSTIMVGHDDANLLTEVDVADFEVRRTIALPAGEWADDIDARPGMTSSFTVVVDNHCCSPSLAGTVLVENGIIAPKRGPGHTGTSSAAFAGDPARLYGHNGEHTGFDFFTVKVDATGLTVLSSYGRLFEGFSLEVVGGGGLIFASNGGVADPTIPVKIGTFSGGGQPVPIPAENRVLMVSGTTINEFELDSYVKVDAQPFGAASAVDAVLAGEQVAIATASQIVFVPLGPDTRTAPGAPEDVVAAGGNGQAAVSWDPPLDDGDAPVTSYTAVADPGGQSCSTSGTSCVVAGLSNGTSYTFSVTATNLKGTGPASAPSSAVTPIGPPSAPSGLVANPADGAAHLSWTAPATNGGSEIIEMTATASPGGASCSTTGTSCTIDGLMNGLEYTFRVSATNAAGAGPLSSVAGPVVPTACDGVGGGPFPDVGAAHAFCGDIEWLTAHEIASGYADGLFHPTSQLSRQAISAFGYRYEGEPDFDPPVFPAFTDVPPEHPFFVEIEWMADRGLVNGYADGSFRPGTVVSRQSLTAMLYRLEGAPAFEAPDTPSFTDVPVTHPFFDEIEWLAAMGVISGYSDGTFRPSVPVSRQGLAAFLHRLDALG